MKRILLLAYYFPPIGGAGAQRNTKLARYLHEFGYDLTVITGPGDPEGRWVPVDTDLSAQVGGEVEVRRLPSPEPTHQHRMLTRARSWLRLRLDWDRWWYRHALALAENGEHDVDLVYCSLAPFATARTAISIARRLDKPLVLDLEDPWALDEMLSHETGLHARLEMRAMRRTLRMADGIVMNTPEAALRVRTAFPELRDIPVISLVNGFDAADFEGGRAPRDDDAFRIVHTGSLHHWAEKRSWLRRIVGGAPRDVDMVTRSLIYLGRALSQLMSTRPDLRNRVELHLAGALTDADRAAIGDAVPVTDYGFLSHDDTVALQRSADLLFLPMHDVAEGHRVAIVPCKTYEYLASARPILAAVPDGDARDMLLQAGNAYVCRPKAVVAMKDAVLAELGRVERNEEARMPHEGLLEQIERRYLTRRLVTFLDELLADHAAGPRSPRTRTEAVTASTPG